MILSLNLCFVRESDGTVETCLCGGMCTLVSCHPISICTSDAGFHYTYLAWRAPCSEGLLTCLPAVTMLKFLILSLNSCMGSEVQWGSCRWAEEIHTGWMSTVHTWCSQCPLSIGSWEPTVPGRSERLDVRTREACDGYWGTTQRGYAFCSN